MQTWYGLADAVIARHQEHVTLDEFFLAEDICYNNGGLISPNMMEEFLFPYYRKLIENVRHSADCVFTNRLLRVAARIGCEASFGFERQGLSTIPHAA
jgi:hypothetical protein